MQSFTFEYIFEPKVLDLNFVSDMTLTDEILHKEINAHAKNYADKSFPYDELCWQLAELELLAEKGVKRYTSREIFHREEEIFKESPRYIDLCWLISELRIYLKQKGHPV